MGTIFSINSRKWCENRRKQEGLILFDRNGRHKENPQPYRNDWGIETLSSGRRLLQEIEDLFNRKIDAIYEKSAFIADYSPRKSSCALPKDRIGDPR